MFHQADTAVHTSAASSEPMSLVHETSPHLHVPTVAWQWAIPSGLFKLSNLDNGDKSFLAGSKSFIKE